MRTTGHARLKSSGHQVRRINPRFVTPYVKTNKNEANDAEAICEAVSRPAMRFVPIQEPSAAGCAVGAQGARVPDAPSQLPDQSNAKCPVFLLSTELRLPKGIATLRRACPRSSRTKRIR